VCLTSQKWIRPLTNSRGLKNVTDIILDPFPLEGQFDRALCVELIAVEQTDMASVWDLLIEQYHPLGKRKGIRIKQLAFIDNRPVAALGWSNPALHLETRDAFVGWDFHQKNANLGHVANNARFLILPWIRLKNLASHLLSRAVEALPSLWKGQTGKPLYLVETFVDETSYQGTCYQAANWLHLGHSKGFARVQKIYFQRHGKAKKVFVYVIEPKFRQLLGCTQRYLPPTGGLREDQIGRLSKLLNQTKFQRDLEEEYRLGEIEELPLKLKEYAEGFRSCFGRASQLEVVVTFWIGLASHLRRKNAEAIALETGAYAPRTLQDFLCSYKWDHDQMLEQHRVNVAKRLNTVGGAIALDPSDNPKKGKESVGVHRQYCGNLGKVENCQSGVYASYIGEHGYELVDGRLFIPQIWFSPEYEERRTKCDMPRQLTYQSRVEIGLEMVKKFAAEKTFDFQWVLGDTLYGASPAFRAAIPEGRHYFLDAKKELLVKPLNDLCQSEQKGQLRMEPKPRSISDLAQEKKLTWQLKQLGTGTKGPIIAKVALLRVEIAKTGEKLWLFIRHDPDGKEKVALSNAPLTTELETFCQLSLMRWKIEQCFRECKDMLGMADYENRTWDGWHRHMALVMTMHFFIQKWCLELDPENKGFTRHMAREIIAAALTRDRLQTKKAIKKVQYHLRRNAQAMDSHWKATVRRAKEWASQLQLWLDCVESSPLSAL